VDRVWNEWQELEEALKSDPVSVIKKLLQETSQFDLAKRLTVTLKLPISLLKVCLFFHILSKINQNQKNK